MWRPLGPYTQSTLQAESDYKSNLEINLLLISEDGRWHYTAIKSLSRLLASKNSEHHCKQHFCMNCLQGFTFESSRDKHYEYCKDNEAVQVEMPKLSSVIEFYDGQNQFKVPFMMYVDFKVILKPMQGSRSGPHERSPDPSEPYTKILVNIFLLDFAFTASLLMGKLRIH